MPRYIGKTSTITVGSALAVAVIASIPGSSITVREDNSVANWPTTDYLVMKPLAASTPIRFPLGYLYEFCNPTGYRIGDIAGYIQTVTGTTTFAQDERGDV
jgi:hypothetical protein